MIYSELLKLAGRLPNPTKLFEEGAGPEFKGVSSEMKPLKPKFTYEHERKLLDYTAKAKEQNDAQKERTPFKSPR